jgi:iron complex outermembrane receptor protein
VQKSPDIAAGLTQTLDKTSSITANAWAQFVNFEKYNGASCYWQTAGTKCPTSTNVTAAQVNGNIVQYFSPYGSQRYREQGGSVAYSKAMAGRWSNFQLGVDYRRLSATDLENFYLAPTTLANLQNFNASTYGKGEQTFTGLFGQTKVSPLDALELTFSGRSISGTSAIMSIRTSSTGVTTGGALPDSSTSAFSPSVGARYELNDRLSIRGAAYKAFRAPGFNNITRTYGTSSSTTIANPDLEPETLRGWELGTNFNSGKLSLGATYFLYNITKMIGTYTVSATVARPKTHDLHGAGFLLRTPASVKYYTNDQDGQSYGGTEGNEASGQPDAGGHLHAYGTYLTRRGSIVTPLGVARHTEGRRHPGRDLEAGRQAASTPNSLAPCPSTRPRLPTPSSARAASRCSTPASATPGTRPRMSSPARSICSTRSIRKTATPIPRPTTAPCPCRAPSRRASSCASEEAP